MTITADGQIELPDRSLLLGPSTNYSIRRRVEGFHDGPGQIEASDLDRQGWHGGTAGRSTAPPRLLSWDLNVLGGKTVAAQRMATVAAAWRPSVTPSDEVALDVRWEGMAETVLRVYGQPRALEVDTASWVAGKLEPTLEFLALDPLWYGAENTDYSGQSGTFQIDAADLGHEGADTRRVTLTIEGNDGTPTLSNDTHGGFIAFAQTLATGETAVIDLREMTTEKAGVNIDSHITAASSWFRLLGGVENELTLTGAASVDLTFRPGYW